MASSSSSIGVEVADNKFIDRVHGGLSFRVFQMVHGGGAASAEIYEYGAHLTSWKLAGQELIFVSKKAIYAEGKAIRGGVPIVFPQFGPGPLPQHGFARNNYWTHKETTINKASGDVTAIFLLKENESTLKVWPYKFELLLTVVLKASSLSMQLSVKNTDDKSFSFTTLLHTYFLIDDITKAAISGLKGKEYIDKVDGSKIKIENDEGVGIVGETDRIYKNAANGQSLYITDGGNCALMVKSSKFSDIVVWNPWVHKAGSMSDFDAEEYKKMICVEAGTVIDPIEIKSGEIWSGAQGISLTVIDQRLAKLASDLANQGKNANL